MSNKSDQSPRLGKRINQLLDENYQKAIAGQLALDNDGRASLHSVSHSLESLQRFQKEAIETAFKLAITEAKEALNQERDRRIAEIVDRHRPCFDEYDCLLQEANALGKERDEKVNQCYILEGTASKELYADYSGKIARLERKLTTLRFHMEETEKPLAAQIKEVEEQIDATRSEHRDRRQQLQETRENQVKEIKELYGQSIDLLRNQHRESSEAERVIVDAEIEAVQTAKDQAFEKLKSTLEEKLTSALETHRSHFAPLSEVIATCFEAMKKLSTGTKEARFDSRTLTETTVNEIFDEASKTSF